MSHRIASSSARVTGVGDTRYQSRAPIAARTCSCWTMMLISRFGCEPADRRRPDMFDCNDRHLRQHAAQAVRHRLVLPRPPFGGRNNVHWRIAPGYRIVSVAESQDNQPTHKPDRLRSFLRVWVCVLTIVIPDDLKHAPTCDSPGEISARFVHFNVR